MTRRSRRNPTGAGIDMNSALLGAGVGALAVYLLTKKNETPAAGVYLPAGAPADEPWMRAMGYKKAPRHDDFATISRNQVFLIDPPQAPVFAGDDFMIDAKVYSQGVITPYTVLLSRRSGELMVISVLNFVGDGFPPNVVQEMGRAYAAMVASGQNDQPFGNSGARVRFGQMRPSSMVNTGVPNSSQALREGYVVPRPQMRSPIPNAMLRWK